MKGFKIRTELNSAKNEKDVENIYRRFFLNALDKNVMIESPYGCDGYLKSIEEQGRLFELENVTFSKNNKEKLKVLFEFKYDEKLEEKLKRSPIILQAIYYLKKFELDGRDGRDFPNVVFVGDKDQCFLIHTNKLQKYLDKNLNWNIAPSQASSVNPDIILEIMEDEALEVHTITVTDDNFKKEIIKNVLELNSNVKPQIRITQHNISRIFEEFVNVILKDKYLKHKEPEKIVGIFIGCIVLPDEYYRHPTKKNILITPDLEFKEVQINGENYKAFCNYFNIKNYTIEEKRKFTETQDRLIEELSRRKNGEYFTPTNWVDEAVKMLDINFGDDWREKYVVWDCASGTKNLTRDYSFDRLYSSTLISDDLKVAQNYNRKNISFQYDFLNDDINLIDGTLSKEELKNTVFKMPKELLEDMLQNKPLLFFINPPYGTANADGAKGDGSKKKGMSLTRVNELMKKEKIGASSQQLYAQFLFKIMKLKEVFGLTNINIATFANPIYMSGSTFKKFRERFLKDFKYKEAMLFRASHFADVKGDWGISFAIWETGETVDKENFIHKVKDIDKDKNQDGEIIEIDLKNIYNTDSSLSLSEWMQGDLLTKNKGKNINFPQVSSPLIIREKGRGTFMKGGIGYLNNLANNIYQSEGGVGIFSAAYTGGNGYSIQPEYFENIISGFVARRLGFSLETWANQKDEFLAPNINHEKYKQYLNDSLILMVFNPKAKMSSLRNIKYKEKKWDILNEFFFMGIEQIRQLALETNNEEIFNDIIEFPRERFLYLKIKEAKLSKEANEVYNIAIELVKKSFKFRKVLAHDSPEYNLNTWDAGWYQIKYILEKYFKNEYKEFDKKYKELFNNWRESLYELEFLKK